MEPWKPWKEFSLLASSPPSKSRTQTTSAVVPLHRSSILNLVFSADKLTNCTKMSPRSAGSVFNHLQNVSNSSKLPIGSRIRFLTPSTALFNESSRATPDLLWHLTYHSDGNSVIGLPTLSYVMVQTTSCSSSSAVLKGSFLHLFFLLTRAKRKVAVTHSFPTPDIGSHMSPTI